MIATLLFAALASAPSCWDVFDAATAHSARAPHPRYVTYNERVAITQDRQLLIYSRAHVDYRDDGVSRVEDERFDYAPFVTRDVEPGPPELGPYGLRREAWLPVPDTVPVIASARAQGRVICSLTLERYQGRDTYHLRFAGADATKAHLDDLWIDRHTHDIWKLAMQGPVYFGDDAGPRSVMAHYEIDLGYQGPYLVVQHVASSFTRREYDQYSRYAADYVLAGFAFPTTLPDSYFVSALPPN
jgi:hypothetical protein